LPEIFSHSEHYIFHRFNQSIAASSGLPHPEGRAVNA